VDAKENCSEEQLKELAQYIAMDPAERESKMTTMKDELKTAEDAHNELLKNLQAQFKESQDALEKLKEESAPVIKLLKQLQATFKESQDALEKLKEDSAPTIKLLKAATPSGKAAPTKDEV
jgi:uncharacterized phage infection (PIP) family protein YhgE